MYCSTVIFYFDDIPLPAVTDQRPRGFHGGRVIWLKPSALCGVFDGQQTVAGICIGAGRSFALCLGDRVQKYITKKDWVYLLKSF